MRGKTAEDEGTRFVPSSVSVVLHFDVVRVDQGFREQLLKYGVVGAMGERLHLGSRHPFARRGIVVLPAAIARRGARARFVPEAGRLFPAAFFVLAPGGFCREKGRRLLPDDALAAPAPADFRDEVAPFFGPQVLSALFLAPAPTSAGGAQTVQRLFLKRGEARRVHELVERAPLVATDDFDGTAGIRILTIDLSKDATFRTATLGRVFRGLTAGTRFLRFRLF